MRSAVLLWRGERWGAYLYGLLTVGTIVWALTESGFDGWALAPRVLPFLVLGLLLLRPKARRSLGIPTERPLLTSPLSWLAIAGFAGNLSLASRCTSRIRRCLLQRPPGTRQIAARDWQHWGGSAAGTRYVPFDQINASNVDKLEIAWSVSHWRRRRVQGNAAADRRHAVCLPRAQHHLRARRRYRREALALRSAAEGLEGRLHDDVSRRHVLQGAGTAAPIVPKEFSPPRPTRG